MKITIKNAYNELTVSSRGAEIVALTDIATGRPIVWTGDASVWAWNAPILFPFVSKLKDGYSMIDGKRFEFSMGHGFIRELTHKLIHASENSMAWESHSDEQTLARYPYKYSFKTRYELTEKGLIFTNTITNTDTRPIYFSFGTHTAFAAPQTADEKNTDFQIEFEQVSDAPEGKHIALSDKGFGNGLLIKNPKSKWIGLRNKKNGTITKVNTEGFPAVMLWQNTAGAPAFICIEPWYGLTEGDDSNHIFEQKPGIVCLDTGRSVTYDQTFTLR